MVLTWPPSPPNAACGIPSCRCPHGPGTCNTIFTKYQSREVFYLYDDYQWYYACAVPPPESEVCNGTSYLVSCPATSSALSHYPCNKTSMEDTCVDPEGYAPEPINFEQPVFQTFQMFCGELLCLFAYGISLYLDKRKGVVDKSKISGLVGYVDDADARVVPGMGELA